MRERGGGRGAKGGNMREKEKEEGGRGESPEIPSDVQR